MSGALILSIILSIFFIGSFSILMSLFEKEETNTDYICKKNSCNNYDNYEDVLISDESCSEENDSDDYGVYSDDVF